MIEIEYYGELCCEECNEIIHNHFEECPACGKRGAGTDVYGGMYEMEEGESISCEECGKGWELVKVDHDKIIVKDD
jgi:hypothetical protein